MKRSKWGGKSGGSPTRILTVLQGLLRELPSPGPWEKSRKEDFMQAFKSIIDLIYPEKDENRTASGIVAKATGGLPEKELNGKNPAAVALGGLGGKKGGLARAKKLSPERRTEIALKAARARWDKKEGWERVLD